MNAGPKPVVGNWKLHGGLSTNTMLLEQIKAVGKTAAMLAACASFPYLTQCQSLLAGSVVTWGARDVSAEARDAFTGEVVASMLSEFNCGYMIIGYSERRSYHSETDAQVAAKALCASERGITPIVCVGETLAQRGADETEQVVGRQLDAILETLSVEQLGHIVVAYELVWAIGTGKTAPSEQARAVHAFPRARVVARDAGVAQRLAILYGGSIKPDNTGELFAMTDIDDGLIDGASLKAEDFLAVGHAQTMNRVAMSPMCDYNALLGETKRQF